MATESHPTFLSADTELVRVYFSVNNIFFLFFFFFQKESTLHWGFITKFRGAVINEGSVKEKNGQGEGANVFKILILKDEKKGINYKRMVILIMNNIVSR